MLTLMKKLSPEFLENWKPQEGEVSHVLGENGQLLSQSPYL